MQSGIHPDWALEDYEGWLRLAKEIAPGASTCTPTRRWRSTHMCDVSGLPPTRCSSGCARPGLGSTPGTAAEVLHDGVRERISPEQAAGGALGRDHRGLRTRAGLRSTVTVMFGHIEEPWELAEHMRVVRELQERTGGFTEFVLDVAEHHRDRGAHARARGGLDDLDPAPHRQLVGRDALAHAVVEHLGRRARRGARARRPAAARTPRRAGRSAAMASTSIGE